MGAGFSLSDHSEKKIIIIKINRGDVQNTDESESFSFSFLSIFSIKTFL